MWLPALSLPSDGPGWIRLINADPDLALCIVGLVSGSRTSAFWKRVHRECTLRIEVGSVKLVNPRNLRCLLGLIRLGKCVE